MILFLINASAMRKMISNFDLSLSRVCVPYAIEAPKGFSVPCWGSTRVGVASMKRRIVWLGACCSGGGVGDEREKWREGGRERERDGVEDLLDILENAHRLIFLVLHPTSLVVA